MIHLIDFCEDGSDEVASIVDARAEWPVGVAVAVLELGLACMAGTGRRAVKQRPSVAQCIDTVKQLMPLPMLPLPPATQKECVACLDAPRGHHRFMPCKHSVCCALVQLCLKRISCRVLLNFVANRFRECRREFSWIRFLHSRSASTSSA